MRTEFLQEIMDAMKPGQRVEIGNITIEKKFPARVVQHLPPGTYIAKDDGRNVFLERYDRKAGG